MPQNRSVEQVNFSGAQVLIASDLHLSLKDIDLYVAHGHEAQTGNNAMLYDLFHPVENTLTILAGDVLHTAPLRREAVTHKNLSSINFAGQFAQDQVSGERLKMQLGNHDPSESLPPEAWDILSGLGIGIASEVLRVNFLPDAQGSIPIHTEHGHRQQGDLTKLPEVLPRSWYGPADLLDIIFRKIDSNFLLDRPSLPIRLLKSYFVEQQLKYLDKISTDSPPAIYALGHTHTPFLQEFSGGIYLNPGMRSMIPVEKHLPFAEPLNVTENHNNGHGSFSFSTIDATNIQLRVIDDLRAYQRGDLNIPERSRVIGSLPIAGLKQSPSVV